VDGIGFSKMISFGNGADLRETELLEYFGEDPETKASPCISRGSRTAGNSYPS
jgi:acyl-CoA synthetase (NDP forming)